MARVTTRQLADFEAHLLDFGRSEGTAKGYVHDVRKAYRCGGPVKRLNNDELAPKTRQRILASMRAWAKWREDGALLTKLERLRLPPADRTTEKIPLSREHWLALIHHLDESPKIYGPVRAALLLMATRGLRRGDTLRIRRDNVTRALKNGTLVYRAKGNRNMHIRVLSTYRRALEKFHTYKHWERVSLLISPKASDPHDAAGKRVARTLDHCGVAIGLEPGDLYPHRLRRTYATLYLQQLGDAPDAVVRLQQHMGWRSLATAMQYVDHARGIELDDVAEAMFDED